MLTSVFGCGSGGCSTSCLADDLDWDRHAGLRLYALKQLGAPPSEYAPVPPEVPVKAPTTEAEFQAEFETCLERQGWPVWKYGKGRKVPRCLLVENGELTWGSKKKTTPATSPAGGQETKDGAAAEVAAVRTSISLEDISDVVREAAADAPANTNPAAMICFVVKDGTGLKILCRTVTDALILVAGFKNYGHVRESDDLPESAPPRRGP